MAFSQNAAWTWWCFTSPLDCREFNLDYFNAMEALKAGDTRPAYTFVEKWQEMADNNETLGNAISEGLASMQQALGDALAGITEPIARGLRPLMGIAALGIVGLMVWKS